MPNDESVHFFCSSCGQSLSATPELFGQSIACPSCQAPITVPLAPKFAPDAEIHAGHVLQPPPPPRIIQPPPPPSGLTHVGINTPRQSEALGYAMLAIVGVSALLIWQSGNLGVPPLAFALIATISTAILGGVEAKKLGMGSNSDLTPKGKKRTTPLSWAVSIFMVFAFVFPMYLYSRGRYGVRNLFLPGIIAAVVFLGSCFMVVPALPSVDAPEVVEAAQKAIRESPGNKRREDSLGTITISYPGQVRYDWYHQKRMAKANLKTNLGTEVIYYSVEWQNRSKGTIWVQIRSQGDAEQITPSERTAHTVPPVTPAAIENNTRTNPSRSGERDSGDTLPKTQSQPAQLQVEGPPESIVRAGVNYMNHDLTYDRIKRAKDVFTSRGLSGPAGTRVYMIRMGDFPMSFSFYQDSFGEWQIQLLGDNGIPIGSACPVAYNPKIVIPKDEV